MKKLLSCFLALTITTALMTPMAGAAGYTDIPADGALSEEVRKAVDYGLMNGYDESRFGYGDSMTRIQFLTVLSRMMKWHEGDQLAVGHIAPPVEQAMQIDLKALYSRSKDYFDALDSAVEHDVVDKTIPFRPDDAITRAEIAEMLVRAMGLKKAANSMDSTLVMGRDTYHILHGGTPFTDLPWKNEGYIEVAYATGMTNGTSATTFSPNATATRAQAASMLVRIYEKLKKEPDFVHGFYAISSYSQLSLAEDLDAVSAGWSRMTWDGETAALSTTGENGNEFRVPDGYEAVTGDLEDAGVPLNLSVFMAGQDLKDMLSTENGRQEALKQIFHELFASYDTIGKNPYSGVTIDFEGLRSENKEDFTAFLSQLSAQLADFPDRPLSLYVCVSPITGEGYADSYSGYDYQAIGELADKVILMAYDYDARDMSQFVGTEYYKTAATAPLDQVYLGIRIITQQMDPAKVVLGFSCKNVAWQIDENGKLLSGTPVYVSNDTVWKRLQQADTETGWSDTYQQPYAVYTTEDGGRYFLWYQDDASVTAALNAAKLLGVTGVSLWRLGTVPMYSRWNWRGLLPQAAQ